MLDGGTWLWRVRRWCVSALVGRKLTVREIEEWLGLVAHQQQRVDAGQREIVERLDEIEALLRHLRQQNQEGAVS